MIWPHFFIITPWIDYKTMVL